MSYNLNKHLQVTSRLPYYRKWMHISFSDGPSFCEDACSTNSCPAPSGTSPCSTSCSTTYPGRYFADWDYNRENPAPAPITKTCSPNGMPNCPNWDSPAATNPCGNFQVQCACVIII